MVSRRETIRRYRARSTRSLPLPVPCKLRRMDGSQSLPRTARERLVVALDVETGSKALDLVTALHGAVGMFKVGKQLFTAEGPELVRKIVGLGERVFLDLKYHDIPATVAKASVEATRMGVSILNVHASGGREM